ncbi:MAG: acyltransferase [Clostridia bacterium]|nr:acyltransferase [Clostridia bacterium]
MKKSEYLPQITVMNALLCLFVVMIHLTFAPLAELIQKSFPHIAIFIINKTLGFCVPTFIFLSGFKLFKGYEKKPLNKKAFLRRRFKKIAVPYFIAVLIYMIYFGAKGWLEDGILKSLFLGTVSAHFYYVVILLQLYLLFPMLFRLFGKHSRTTFVCSVIITLFCVVFLQSGYWDRFFGTYIFYFVFGMFWAKYDLYELIKKYLRVIALSFAVLLILHLTFLYLSNYSGIDYSAYPIVNMLYDVSAMIMLYAVSYEFLQKLRTVIAISGILGKYTYTIYLYHCLAIFILRYDVLSKYNLSVKWNFFVSTVLIYSMIALLCAVSYLTERRKEQ